jgi:DNA-binding NtrC family response regulator
LGLASCYSIIRNHNGLITFSSEINKGTSFYVYLPTTEGTPFSESIPDVKYKKFHGNVMIMDDDINILVVLKSMLVRLGFDVTSTKGGQELLSLYQEDLKNHKRYQFFLLDLTIPGGLGGKETVQQLLKMDPSIKVIVSSGYSNDPVLANYSEYGFIGVLKKPYTIADLQILISSILE